MTKTKAPRPIGECVGKLIVCPDCGSEARICNMQAIRIASPIITAKFWVMMRCKGACGAKLMKTGVLVHLQAQSEPEPELTTLGEAIGKFVFCPHEECGVKSLAMFDSDEGHSVKCPVHQIRPYDPLTIVELA